MSNRISVLMTVYNEADFIEYAIRACLPYIDDLVIVEGAYQETIVLGAEPRSTDGTREKINALMDLPRPGDVVVDKGRNSWYKKINNCQVAYSEMNEQSDKDQRNVGLEEIKKRNPDGWILIIDGDEVYDENNFSMVKVAMYNMEKTGKLAAYFKSLTFVNDLKHYTEQEFPRLFRITPECRFINDNFMEWPDKEISWFSPCVIKIPYIRYLHFAFCKGRKKFLLKKKWWETRFEKEFDYGWDIDDNDKISDPNHQVYDYTGDFPDIIKDHPLYKKTYG